MKTALLIIDVQQGLCEGEGRAFESDEVIARINGVATQVRGAGRPVAGRSGAWRPTIILSAQRQLS